MAENKYYRAWIGADDTVLFQLSAGQSDLLVGVRRGSWKPELAVGAAAALAAARAGLEAYIARHPAWAASFSPCACEADAPPLVLAMTEVARAAGVGPMAAVAGAVADAVLDALADCPDAFVENGGDCALRCTSTFTAGIGAGDSPFSGLGALVLPPGRWGVATSAGRLGHSTSLGRADALTAVDTSAALADAWATARANLVGGPSDVEEAVSAADVEGGPLAIFAAAGQRMAYKGKIKLAPLRREGSAS